MASSLEASRRYLGAARKLGNSRSRSMLSGVTPIPAGGASSGAFAAKLGSVALDYFSNKELEKYAEQDRQFQIQERDLRIRALEQKLLPKPTRAVQVGSATYNLKENEAATLAERMQPNQAAPEAEYDLEKGNVFGFPAGKYPKSQFMELGRQSRAKSREKSAASELAKIRFQSGIAQKQLAELDQAEQAEAQRMLTQAGDPVLTSLIENASRGNVEALGKLGLPEIEDLNERIMRVKERAAAMREKWAEHYLVKARAKYGPQREALRGRLQGVATNPLPTPYEEDEEPLTPEEQRFHDAVSR